MIKILLRGISYFSKTKQKVEFEQQGRGRLRKEVRGNVIRLSPSFSYSFLLSVSYSYFQFPLISSS